MQKEEEEVEEDDGPKEIYNVSVMQGVKRAMEDKEQIV